VSSPVRAGASATLTAQTTPGANCTITVYYKSGRSTAAGLISKTADSGGRVSWTWKVGSNTTSGSWRIVVASSFNGETTSQTTYFTVR
jgi:5-hydroxyisourate hydrolase-like protein (transthyretin family)